ncbi:MAG: PAS domain S-box protein [Nitrospirota bacterium]|nr:MAG: PAS domain S-box protein [Nitrospirota bacterium]
MAGKILGSKPMQDGENFKKADKCLQTLLEAMHEGVWDWNIESNAVNFSDSWCRSLGYDHDGVTHHFSFYERLIHPQDWPEVKKQLQDHLEGKTPIFESENRILMKSGNWRWNLDRGKVVAWDANGKPTRMLLIGVDISERKMSEERENLQRTILEKTVTGNSLNEVLNDLCVQVEQIVPSSICTAMLIDKSEGVLNVVAASQGQETVCEILNGTVPGEFSGACGAAAFRGEPVIITDTEQDPRWDRIRETARPLGIKACWSIPILSEQKKPVGTFAISHPVIRQPSKFDLQLLETASSLAGIAIQCTEGKEALKNSEDRYRVLYEDNPTMYFTVSSEGRVLSVNQFGAQQLGYTVDELVGKPVLNVFFNEDKSTVQEKMKQCLQDPDNLGRWQARKLRKDGSLLWVRETVRVLKLAHDQFVFFIVCEDITEQKHIEEMLRSSKEAIRELYEITSSPTSNLEHRIRDILELGCRRFGLPMGLVTRKNEETLIVQYAYPSHGFIEEGTLVPLCDTFCNQALRKPEPIMIKHASSSEWRNDPGYTALGLESYLGMRVLVGHETFGTLCFIGKEPHEGQFSETDKDFLMLMAQWLGNELKRQQDEASIRNINLALSKAMPAISRLNKNGQYVEVNAAYAKMMGYDPSELIGLPWERTVYPEDLPIPLAAYQTMLEEGQSEFESRAIRKDGSVFYKHVLLIKEFDLHGTHTGHRCFMGDVTERKFSEEALRESEGRLQSILDNSSAVIYVKDLQGKYLLINRKYETLFNLTRDSVKGKTDFDIFPYKIAKTFTENDQKVIDHGEPLEREEVAPHEDGLHTYISNKFLLRHANGTPYALCGISTDITQRKEAEKNTRLHNHILESSPNGILITDWQQPDNPLIFCNAAFEKITGYALNEIYGQNCRFLQGNDTDQEGLHQIRAAIKAKQGCQVVLRNFKKDGTLFWNDLKLAPVFNDQGELTNYIGVLVDITERKNIEDALRTLAETAATLTGKDFLQFIVKTLANCLNFKYAFITECVDPSKQTLRTLAFWNGTAFGENFEYGLVDTPCQEVIEGEVCFYPRHVQQHFPHDEDLKTLNVESYVGYPLFSKSGEILGHMVAMDIQEISAESGAIPIIKLFASRAAAELERNRAEMASRRSEGRLRQVIDLVPQLIFAKDTEGRFILCNEALANLYGTTVQALIGKSDEDFAVSQEEMNKFRKDDLEVIESGKVKVIKEEQLTDMSGELHYLHTTKIPFVFADTTLPSVLGVSTDITEQKMVESQLRESYERTRELTARLEAAEESERKRIARELHDEFGQMLTGLKFDTAWLNRHLAKEKGVASLQPYLNKLKGMSTLLDQTIQSVRRIATSLRPTILDDLGLIPALEWQAQEFQGRTGVQCQVTTAPDMTNTALGAERATALFRIVQELLTNVMRHAEASKVNLDLHQKDNFVILTIQDNGRGITEREIGHGPSLGLLGIKERIAPFGGKLQIHGESGKGTRATVFIPLLS